MIHAGVEEFALRSTLEAMGRRLDRARFARANRGAILNVESIVRLERDEKNEWEAVLFSGVRVSCSKKYWSRAL
ncbi:MAG: LytTR family transcriptional regulator [Acidobacteria bacterium]|nr:LytTR family transcriptional regulator [Acidobacteriota bacterium]